jgi:hypothetical protein
MSADKDFKVKATVTGDASGAKQVNDALDAAAKKTEDLGNKSEVSGKKAERFGLKMSELKKLTHELGNEFPIAGMAIRAFLNPVGFALTAAIGLFAKVKEHIQELNKSLDEVGDRAAKGFGNMKEAIEDATRDIAAKSSAAAAELKKIADAEKEIQERTDAATEAIRRQERAKIALTDAVEAQQLSEVDAQRELHKADPSKGMDDVTAAKWENKIKADAEQRRIAIQNNADQAAINQKANQLGNAVLEQRRLQAVVDPLEKNHVLREAKLGPNGLPAQITGLDEERKANQEKIEKAKADRDAATAELAQHGGEADMRRWLKLMRDAEAGKPSASLDDSRFKEGMAWTNPLVASSDGVADLLKASTDAQAALKSATEDQTRVLTSLTQAKDEQAKLTQEKTDYETAKAERDKSKELVRTLTNTVDSLNKAAKDDAAFRAQEAAIKTATANTGMVGKIIAGAQNNGTPPGKLPPGVIIGPDGQLTADPKTLPGYIAPPTPPRPHSTFPDFSQIGYDLSPEEIERRGGNPAGTTRANRAKETEAHAKQTAADAAAVSRDMAEVARIMSGGMGNLAGAVKLLKDDLQRQARDIESLKGWIQASKNFPPG